MDIITIITLSEVIYRSLTQCLNISTRLWNTCGDNNNGPLEKCLKIGHDTCIKVQIRNGITLEVFKEAERKMKEIKHIYNTTILNYLITNKFRVIESVR